MQTFSPRQNQFQKPASADFARTGKPMESAQPQRRSEERDVGAAATTSRAAQDLSRLPIHPPAAEKAQAKLTIGKPGDAFEQEADRFSEQVMRMPAHPRANVASGVEARTQSPSHPHERPQVARAASGVREREQTPAPAIVHEVLQSSGQPLDPAARDVMEQRFGQDFGHIRIHADALADRASASLGAEAFAAGNHIAFACGSFQPGTPQGERLMAHELTHTIQQAATSRYVARKPQKGKDTPAAGELTFDGVVLGTNRAKQEVRVKREIGATQGYEERLQATAVARLAKADPAAVALGTDQKWYALETSAAFEEGLVDASELATGKVPFVKVHGLPPFGDIAASQNKVKDLATKLKADDVPQAEKEQASTNLLQANQDRVKSILGVPESEVQLTRSLTGRTAGKINIIGSPGQDRHDGRHGPLTGDGSFEPGLVSAFSINLPVLDDPGRAQAVLFHEVQHQHDWELAQTWVNNYQTETKGIFVKSATGPFEKWLKEQTGKDRLTKADAEVVIMETHDDSAYTEARANVRTFLAALQSGATEVATKALFDYVHALKPRKDGGTGEYANPANGSQVEAALVAELKAAYAKMPKPMQQQYDAAVAAAKKEFPGAWISALDFAKRGGK